MFALWTRARVRELIGRAGVSGPEDLKAKALAALHRLQKLPDLVRSFAASPTATAAIDRAAAPRDHHRTELRPVLSRGVP